MLTLAFIALLILATPAFSDPATETALIDRGPWIGTLRVGPRSEVMELVVRRDGSGVLAVTDIKGSISMGYVEVPAQVTGDRIVFRRRSASYELKLKDDILTGHAVNSGGEYAYIELRPRR